MNSKDISVEGIMLKVLIYGRSGTGKTSFACSFPRPYVFDFDNGMLSQRGRDVEFDCFSDWKSAEAKLRELEADCKYETIIIDSITTMQEYMMKDILLASKRSKPTLHEWGSLIDRLQDVFMRATKMASHVIITAHEQLIQDDITSEVQILPLIVGKKLPGQITIWFDEAYRMQVGRGKKGEPVYQLLTRADTKYTAKSRLRVLDTVTDWSSEGKMVNPYELIMEKLKGKGV